MRYAPTKRYVCWIFRPGSPRFKLSGMDVATDEGCSRRIRRLEMDYVRGSLRSKKRLVPGNSDLLKSLLERCDYFLERAQVSVGRVQ